MTKLAFIWAENNQGYIGKEGKLPWSLPNDMKFFKETTMNHPVVMGRKTFDSLTYQPLPKRLNIVITRDQNFSYPGVEVAHNLAEFHEILQNLTDDLAFVIGGKQIFDLLQPEVEYLYKTQIDNEIVGDVKMVPLDYQQFELQKEIPGVVDSKNLYPHRFQIYQKNHN